MHPLRTYRLLGVAFAMLLLAGCGGDAGETGDGRTVIRFNLLLISAGQVDHFKWVEQEYERLHPDIDVVFEQFPGSSLKDFEIKLRLRFASGQAPDIFFINDRVVAEFARFGLLSPAPDFITAYADSMSLNPAIRDAPYFGGVSYGITSDIAPTVLYYNKDMFREAGLDPERPPRTWSELLDYADRLTVRSPDGAIQRAGFSLRKTGFKPGTAEKWLTFLFSAGGEAFDEAGTRALLNSPQGRKAIDFYDQVLFKRHIDAVTLEGDQQGFGQQRVAMFLREVHVVRWMQENYPDIDFGVAPIPAEEGSYSAGGTYIWSVSGDSPHQEEAWRLIDFMMSHEVYDRYAIVGGALPTIKSVAALPRYQDDPYLRTFLAQDLRVLKPFPRMQQALEIVGAYIERFCYGQIAANEVLPRMEEDLNALLAPNRP
ncbi:MAG: ABC transporter substrate-binding protein [Rhodothermales bacterium]